MKYYGKETTTIHPNGCVAMTWEDAEEAEKLNKCCNWGFDMADCIRFLSNHMDCYLQASTPEHTEGATKEMEIIEWRLTDCNYHQFCKLLHDHNYYGALKYIYEDYAN